MVGGHRADAGRNGVWGDAGGRYRCGAHIGVARGGGLFGTRRLLRQSGSHRRLRRDAWENYTFAFHDGDEMGAGRLAQIAKKTRLRANRKKRKLAEMGVAGDEEAAVFQCQRGNPDAVAGDWPALGVQENIDFGVMQGSIGSHVDH